MQNADQSSGLVVMNIHQYPGQSVRVTRVVLLAFAHVHEAPREAIPVVGVVAAAAPHPVLARRRQTVAGPR